MRYLRPLISLIGTAALAVTLVAAGFAACLIPATTSFLAQRTSAVDLSPYTETDLLTLAQTTRNFTVDDFGRSSQGNTAAQNSLCQLILSCAQNSSNSSECAQLWSSEALSIIEQATKENPTLSASEAVCALGALDDSYALDANALDHLQDCNTLIAKVIPVLVALAVLALALLGALHFANRKYPWASTVASRIFIAAPVLVAAFCGICAVWGALDFNGFFGMFHQIFFPQGNWTFSYDSLLICMYPLDFWVGMASIWVLVTVFACIICITLGFSIRRKALHEQ